MISIYTLILILCKNIECSNDSEEISRRMEGFIIGGEFTKINDYPHAIYLHAFCASSTWSCGASILNQWVLITAAHCLESCVLKRSSNDRVKIVAGTADLHKINIKRSAVKFVLHEQFEEKKLLNDIGLVSVDDRIPLRKGTKRIIIRNSFPDDMFGYVAGWGIINDQTQASSPLLKHVYQPLRSKATCRKAGMMHLGMFCAGSTNFNDEHPANGDSGSCLVTESYTCIGLVSYRVAVYPALLIYTNISYYYKWIKAKSKQLVCNGLS